MNIDRAKFILIGIVGPVITFFLYIKYKGWSGETSGLAIRILILTCISVLIAFSVSLLIRNFKAGMIISIFLCELIFVLLLIYVEGTRGTEKQQAEFKMFQPIIAGFLVLFTLPLAGSISYAVIKLCTYKRQPVMS